MPKLIKVPYLGIAEEDVLLSEWLVEVGDTFQKGDTLATVETLKASFEVEAECSGEVLRHLVSAGTRVPVQAVLGAFGEVGEVVDEAALQALLGEGAARPAGENSSVSAQRQAIASPESIARAGKTSGGLAPAAPIARRRAEELGISLDTVTGTGPGGMIKVEDVERAALDGGQHGSSASAQPATGDVDPEFLEHLRRDGAAFAALDSAFKVDLYRRHGAIIGEDVRIGAGTVLISERLVLGDGSGFGADCSVVAKEFVAGKLAQFGPRCVVRCTRVRLGDNAYFVSDVEIGGGGALDPEGELVVGSHGFVGEHVHLNPCRRLEIGDEVMVSRDAVVMTHSIGGSILDGYPNRFAGVKIGDACQIGIGAVLFPGTEMGAGSILLSASSLVTAMPAGRMFGGAPAKDLKAATSQVSPAQRHKIAREFVVEFGRQLSLRGFEVELKTDDIAVAMTVLHEGRVHRLAHCAVLDVSDGESCAEDLRICDQADDAVWADVPPELTAIDLKTPKVVGQNGPLGDAFREFLRKRGVRLEPRSWTYPGGWL